MYGPNMSRVASILRLAVGMYLYQERLPRQPEPQRAPRYAPAQGETPCTPAGVTPPLRGPAPGPLRDPGEGPQGPAARG